jgi:hypothetical protein
MEHIEKIDKNWFSEGRCEVSLQETVALICILFTTGMLIIWFKTRKL